MQNGNKYLKVLRFLCHSDGDQIFIAELDGKLLLCVMTYFGEDFTMDLVDYYEFSACVIGDNITQFDSKSKNTLRFIFDSSCEQIVIQCNDGSTFLDIKEEESYGYLLRIGEIMDRNIYDSDLQKMEYDFSDYIKYILPFVKYS